ncbi:MAG TPA: leucine-rich repeat domain-containing protein [Pirellulales bacterium]|nr:leucine-rich repeat domain-containing protein [Pirellulales bacterium]
MGLLLLVQSGIVILVPWTGGDPYLTWSGAMLALAAGSLLAWPPLLAIWAALGANGVFVRFTLTLWLACTLGLAQLYAVNRNIGEQGLTNWTLGTLYEPVGGLLVFGALQIPLWLCRVLGRWRLNAATCGTPSDEESLSDHTATKGLGQFSVRYLIGSILAVALLLQGWRVVCQDVRLSLGNLHQILRSLDVLRTGHVTAGLTVILLAWVMLAGGRRYRLRAAFGLAIMAVLVSFGRLMENYDEEHYMPVAERLVCQIGAVLNGLISFSVVRAWGYRLERQKTTVRDDERSLIAAATPSRFYSFVATSTLAVVAVGLLGSVPHRLGQWHRSEIEFTWSRIGLKTVVSDDGTISELRCRHAPPLPDDICRRISELVDLRVLDLTGSTIDDRQLALLLPLSRLEKLTLCSTNITGLEWLSQFPRLEHLSLRNTVITDSDLANLTTLPHLATLDLSLTEVTDDGLTILERLPALKRLDLSLTAVSGARTETLRRSNPQANIDSGASNALLQDLFMLTKEYALHSSDGPFNERHRGGSRRVRLKKLHARGALAKNGEVESVSGVGIVSLLGTQPELEDLDLRESSVNDFDVDFLVRLKSLRRLDLRGSNITDEGATKLAQALPKCEILR